MINVDIRRYGTDKEYKKFVDAFISGADIDEEPTELKLVHGVNGATDEEKTDVSNEK